MGCVRLAGRDKDRLARAELVKPPTSSDSERALEYEIDVLGPMMPVKGSLGRQGVNRDAADDEPSGVVAWRGQALGATAPFTQLANGGRPRPDHPHP